MVAVERQPLALVEHRRVRGVVVGAVGAPDGDHPERQIARQHRAHLHRRGVGAQHARRFVAGRGQVERVVVGARRVMRRDVERAEIVPVALDVRSFGDGEAHGAEDRRDLLHRAADRMDQAGGARARRQRGIEPLGGEAGVECGRFQRGAPASRSPWSVRPSARSARRRARVAARARSCRDPSAAPSAGRSCPARRRARRPRRADQRPAARAASVSVFSASRSSDMDNIPHEKGPPCGGGPFRVFSFVGGNRDQARAACTFFTISAKLAASS